MPIQDNGAPIKDKGKYRKIIRKKIAQILTNQTDAGARVFPNASVLPGDEELPVILIYPRSENATLYAVAPRELERAVDVTIEIVAKGPEINTDLQTPENDEKTLEDILDDIADQVEVIMAKDETFGGLADDSILSNTEFEFESSGGSPIGSARLTYSVTYYAMSPRKSEDGQADFATANIDYNVSEDENTREATDTVDIPIT